MGYYAHGGGRIVVTDPQAAADALRAAMTEGLALEPAGRWYCTPPADGDDVGDLLHKCGWDVDGPEDDLVFDLSFSDKTGDEEKALDVIAPWVADTCTDFAGNVHPAQITMVGEDDGMWAYQFRGGRCHNVDAVITFPEPDDGSWAATDDQGVIERFESFKELTVELEANGWDGVTISWVPYPEGGKD